MSPRPSLNERITRVTVNSVSIFLGEDQDALRDESRLTRRAAAQALGCLGPAALPALPGLMDALRDADLDVCLATAEALGCLGPAALPGLINAVRDESKFARRAAIQTLGGLGPAALPALPTLLEALLSEDLDVRWTAFDSITRHLSFRTLLPRLLG